jgi:hypothetical protein
VIYAAYTIEWDGRSVSVTRQWGDLAAPKRTEFAVGDGYQLLDYLKTALQVNPDSGRMFSGQEYGFSLYNEATLRGEDY